MVFTRWQKDSEHNDDGFMGIFITFLTRVNFLKRRYISEFEKRGLLNTLTFDADNFIKIGSVVSDICLDRVKSWGCIYLSRRVYSAKYGNPAIVSIVTPLCSIYNWRSNEPRVSLLAPSSPMSEHVIHSSVNLHC